MVKVILQIYPVIPAKDEDERRALRPIGRNVERYHEVIKECDELVKACGFYTSNPDPTARTRQLRVAVNREGVTVQSRTSYTFSRTPVNTPLR